MTFEENCPASPPPIFKISPKPPKAGVLTRLGQKWSGRKRGYEKIMKATQCRLINRNNPYHFNVVFSGVPFGPLFGDMYHLLLDTTWWKLLIGLSIFFFFQHLFFATLYYQDTEGLRGLHRNSGVLDFWSCFFFSVQTMQTIGYGVLSPDSVYCNILVCLQAFWGMLSTAIITGFVFAKIGRPSRQKRAIIFSEAAVVNNHERYWHGNPDRLAEGSYTQGGAPCLVFRFGNIRKSQVCEPRFRLLLIRQEKEQGDVEDERIEARAPGSHFPPNNECFRIHELNYEINSMEYRARGVDFSSALLPLPWTVVHVMDERSPLFGSTPDSLAYSEAEIIAVFDGTDEGCSAQLQARWSYTAREIIWNARLVPIVSRHNQSGKFLVDFSRFNDVQPTIYPKPRNDLGEGDEE